MGVASVTNSSCLIRHASVAHSTLINRCFSHTCLWPLLCRRIRTQLADETTPSGVACHHPRASLFFYAWWNWRFVFLLMWAVLSNWYAGTQIERSLRSDNTQGARNWLLTAIVGDLLILGVFKYYDFFALELSNLLGANTTLPLLELTLPVGISFFTFQAMSYVIDLKRDLVKPMPFLDFAVYLSFFPQLVAGPIVRASEMAPQITHRPDPRRVQSAEAFHLILRGLFKKVVISAGWRATWSTVFLPTLMITAVMMFC